MHGEYWNAAQLLAGDEATMFHCWVSVTGGLIVFIFTGFGRDATGMYSKGLSWIGLDRCFVRCKAVARAHLPRPSKRSASGQAALMVDSLKFPASRFVMKRENTSAMILYTNGQNSTFTITDGDFSSSTSPRHRRGPITNALVSWPLAVWRFLRASISTSSTIASFSQTASLPAVHHHSHVSFTSDEREGGGAGVPPAVSTSGDSVSKLGTEATVSARAWANNAGNSNGIDEDLDLEMLGHSPSDDVDDAGIHVRQMISQKTQPSFLDV